MRSAKNDLENTIKITRQHCRIGTFRTAFKQPCNPQTLSCKTQWNCNGIATHYCRTHRFHAAAPMHKVSQHMQNTIALHQQRTEKVTWNLSVPLRVQKSNRNRRQSDDARTRRAIKRANFSPQPNLRLAEKTQCFVQILTVKSHP